MISDEEVDIKQELVEEYDTEFNDIEFEVEPVYSDEKDEEEEQEEEFNAQDSKQRTIAVHLSHRDKIYNKTKKLIELVKNCPVLYNLRHNDYGYKSLKNLKWKQIAETIEEESVFITKKKWKGLRDTYIKYLRAQKYTKKKSYRKWRWVHLMSFLQPFIDPQIIEIKVTPRSKNNQKLTLQSKNNNQKLTSQSKNNNQKLTSQSKNNNQKLMSQSKNNNQKLKSQSKNNNQKLKSQSKNNNQKLTSQSKNNKQKLTSQSKNNNQKLKSQSKNNNQKLKSQSNNQEKKFKCDSTDILFLGYAKALKKLSQRIQVKANAKIAKIIKDAEVESGLGSYRKSLGSRLQRLKKEQMFNASRVSKITDPLLLTSDLL